MVTRLNGMLDSNSAYMQTARAAGTRTASRRGMLNSSIAAGAAESAAIAAGAPLASQDSQQTAQRNMAVLEGNITLDNNRNINEQQAGFARETQERDFAGRGGLMTQEAAITRDRDLLLQQGATEQQMREFDQRTLEQTNNLSSEERRAMLNADTNILQTRLATSAQLTGNYLSAFTNLAGDQNIPAATRNAYIAELQRVTAQGQAYAGVVADIPISWSGGTQTTQPVGTPTPAPTFGPGSYEAIEAMRTDGIPGNYAAATR